MDTIVLCKMFHSSDKLSKSYNLLPSHSPVIGYSTWITNVKNLDQSCAWIKINCHELLRVQNVSKDDIETLTKFLDRQLIKIGLSRHDFNINRIDYDYNVVVSKAKRKALLEILDGLPKRAMRMKKEDFPPSVYYMCKARHFQIYDKGLERIDKGKYIRPWEVDVLRQEVQCHSDHIRYKAKCGLQSTWDNWVNLDLQAYYLKNAKPIFPKGNFYSLGPV